MGAVAIAKALASCSKLERLELDENQISEDGVAHLKVSVSQYLPCCMHMIFIRLPCSDEGSMAKSGALAGRFG
jgi:hypothetical protein